MFGQSFCASRLVRAIARLVACSVFSSSSLCRSPSLSLCLFVSLSLRLSSSVFSVFCVSSAVFAFALASQKCRWLTCFKYILPWLWLSSKTAAHWGSCSSSTSSSSASCWPQDDDDNYCQLPVSPLYFSPLLSVLSPPLCSLLSGCFLSHFSSVGCLKFFICTGRRRPRRRRRRQATADQLPLTAAGLWYCNCFYYYYYYYFKQRATMARQLFSALRTVVFKLRAKGATLQGGRCVGRDQHDLTSG